MLVKIFSSTVNEQIEKRTELFAKEITSTTQDKLKGVLQDNIDAGGTRKDLEKRIGELYEGFDKNRAKTIARTEVHNSFEYGKLEGYRQAGVPTKIWVSALSAETRDWHASMDGDEVPIDQPFVSGLGNNLMFPGDGPPEDSINCQCQL